MKPPTRIKHQFVDAIPTELEDGTLYISIEYSTALHKCFCGCGNEVVTPLSPTDWKLVFDGETISLDPSIGNWSFDCQSHYWIEDSIIKWAPSMSKEKIEEGRARDRLAKSQYFENKQKIRDSRASYSAADRSMSGAIQSSPTKKR
jgi:hypothetical protein